jgi:hypothetical protein
VMLLRAVDRDDLVPADQDSALVDEMAELRARIDALAP